MQYEVRGATHDDVAGIQLAYLRSWRAAYEPFLEPGLLDQQAELRANFDWSRGIDATTAAVLVAVDGDGSVLGVLPVDEDLDPPRDLPEITMLYVDPPAWGTGISSNLLAVGLTWIADRGHSEARLRVVEQHHRALRFHEREGWAPDPDLEPARNDFFRLIYYRRSLTSP